MLLEAGADKNLADNDGSTALMMAAVQGHATVLRLLLEAGADKNLADNDGSTALMMAARGGHADVMRLLLEAFADANLANNQGTTALMGRSFWVFFLLFGIFFWFSVQWACESISRSDQSVSQSVSQRGGQSVGQ